MSEFEKRQDEAPGGGGPGGHFVPPPPGPPTRGPNTAPPPNSGGYGYHQGHGPHSGHSSFSPGTNHQQKMKHSMPPSGIPPVTPPHMPSQQRHLREAPSSASSHYMSPQQHYGSHIGGGGGAGAGNAGSFVPYNRRPIEHHEARGHHHRHGPHVSRSSSGSLGDVPPTPKSPKQDSTKDDGSAAAAAASATANSSGPTTFADFEPPRSEVEPSHKRQSRHDDNEGNNAADRDSTRAPNSPPDTKKQRTLAPSASKDGGLNISPTLTFASRCDSFRGAIAGTGVGLPTGMSFGMPGHDAQILQSWSAGSFGMGRPNSPSDVQVCYDGWNRGNNAGAPPPLPGAGPPPPNQRSPIGPPVMMTGRSSWDEPIPLGSASMMEFDNAKAAGQRWPPTQGSVPMRQGSFGPPPLQQHPRDARFGFSRGMSMSGEFAQVDSRGGASGSNVASGQYIKTPSHGRHPSGQRHHGAGWFDNAPSFPSPHGRNMSQRRDELDHLSSPRGGWSQDPYARQHGGSFGYHQSPPRPYPPMHGMRYDDSRRDPSPPYMVPGHQLQHHAGPGSTNKMSLHAHSGQLRTPDGVLLLAMPDDRISLSETLCVVRENVEVFCATEADIKAPAPGRKRPVTVGQIGLRCIHCRNATNPGDRVKRAICFPSSIKRIYRTVIDMKLDHFKACRYVPTELKTRLAELKATNGRSTGTTMQYFVSAARKMGMTDGPNGCGVRYDPSLMAGAQNNPAIINQDSHSPGQPHRPYHRPHSNTIALTESHMSFDRQIGLSSSSGAGMGFNQRMHPSGAPMSTNGSMLLNGSGSSLSMGSFGAEAIKFKGSEDLSIDSNTEFFTGKASLAVPEDKTSLSPLRCFLRENVIAFSATAEDIAVRTPTTFSVVEGQVGIGCVHCYNLPAKQRSNRAVCFPFSIARIYQSVADIQRFHFNECKMVPKEVRAKFTSLQNASSKGSKGLATRQYWISSAKKLGLADTNKGIRFIRDPESPTEQPVSLDILAQVASDVTTASKPLVLPEDKPNIAEFLFVVMDQLQPCRFTEADRNKRRLKNLGCIGVECKHCAGKVESRKFFWSSVNAVESNFVSVHTHMMECKFVPQELKDQLAELKLLRKEQTARLKVGSQKAFFHQVWKRLHANEEEQKQQQQQQQQQQEELMLKQQQEQKSSIKQEHSEQHPQQQQQLQASPPPPPQLQQQQPLQEQPSTQLLQQHQPQNDAPIMEADHVTPV
mmetsp:Transcript_5041/g.11002  ORF Transcript_5041/g.11002 Transcript_5041/m.11002 type:complete len:1222 (+) Transcript_5041:300-3965(+)